MSCHVSGPNYYSNKKSLQKVQASTYDEIKDIRVQFIVLVNGYFGKKKVKRYSSTTEVEILALITDHSGNPTLNEFTLKYIKYMCTHVYTYI